MIKLLEYLTYCFIAGVSLSFLVFIWNQTHFVIEYGKLFGLSKFLKVTEWETYANKTPDAKYPYFLRDEHPCWFTKLIGCPFCISGFMSLPFALLITWWAPGVVAFVSSLGFLLLMLSYKKVYS